MKKIISFFTVLLLPSVVLGASVDMSEPKVITADKIEYDLKTETIKTTGDTEIVNASGQRMTLIDSYLTKNGESLSGDDIRLWLGNHVYIESENIERKGDITIARNALFTACDNCDSFGDAWKISTYKIVHNISFHIIL